MKYRIPSFIFLRVVNRIKKRFYYILYIMLYESPRERLFMALNFMFFGFLKLVKPLLSIRARDKIDKYYLSFYKVNLFRHPVSILNTRKEMLRVCITYRCNAACEVCYAKGMLEEFPKDMSLNDFVYLITWAKKQGWRKIMFLGGEPTVHPQFQEILDICYNQNMAINLSTNALFDDRILQGLKPPWIEEIVFDYLEGQIPSPSYKKQFFHNLEYLRKEGITLVLSGVIDGETDRWEEIVDIASRFKLSIRWSLMLPGYSGDLSNQRVFSNPEVFGMQLLHILKTCEEKNIFGFVYRPVPICIFTPQQLQQIRKMGRYLVFTRCILGYRGDYTLALTVNPDLSTYPCNNFYIKGPPITYFKDKDSINRYYEQIDKDVLLTTPAKKCDKCQLYQNFLSIIKNKNSLVKERLFNENVCQAGCVDYRNGARAFL